MFFLPLRADFSLSRIPFLTILICLICMLVFYSQVSNRDKITQLTQSFCEQQQDRVFDLILKKVYTRYGQGGCLEFIYRAQSSKDSQQVIADAAKKVTSIANLNASKSQQLALQRLSEKYRDYRNTVPKNLTIELAYEPRSYSFYNMFTATVAHSDYMHILGNLFIFLAFAASVEIALGFLKYLGLYIVLSISTAVSYSVAMSVVSTPLPTIGLSGVVMGMIGTFMFLVPYARIRCFLWVVVFFRIISVPAWILAGWYVGWDIYQLFYGSEQSNINLVAHVSGACFGYLFGFLFCGATKKQIAHEMGRTRRARATRARYANN